MKEPTKALLNKIRFIEWLSTRHGELSSLQFAIAVRLVSLYSAHRGAAWPSLDRLARDLDVSRRSVTRALTRLVEMGFITKRRGGGRGHATEYIPRFDLLPEGDVYAASCGPETGTAASPFPSRETGTVGCINRDRSVPLSDGETGTVGCINRDRRRQKQGPSATETGTARSLHPVQEEPFYISDSKNRSFTKASLGSDGRLQGDDSLDGKLAAFERWWRANRERDDLPHENLRDWRDALVGVATDHDCQSGDPIGGRAGRLAQELHDWLDDHEHGPAGAP